MDDTLRTDTGIPQPRVAVEVIGGRAPTWPTTAPTDDEDYEPTIVRGRD